MMMGRRKQIHELKQRTTDELDNEVSDVPYKVQSDLRKIGGVQ
jgi:hypothetical protein